jgi:hypothetical protein
LSQQNCADITFARAWLEPLGMDDFLRHVRPLTPEPEPEFTSCETVDGSLAWEDQRRKVKIVWALSIAAVGVGIIWWFYPRSYINTPLADCPYLKNVVEPVFMKDGLSYTDGGSISVEFQDAKGRTRSVFLKNEWGSVDGRANLVVGWAGDRTAETADLPIAGREERALLGLLERWLRDDPTARIWKDKEERHAPELFESSEWKNDPRSRGTVFALGIMDRLKKRN